METVSTDDAYVNGHVTFVAPRVAGQVSRVLVDDNDRVKKGDLLVQLDKEPYQVQVDIKKAAVVNAEADLDGRRGPGPGHPGPGPEPALEAPEGDRGRRRHRSPSSGPGSRPCGARRRPSTAPGPTSRGPRQLFSRRRDRPRGVRPAPRGRADGRGRGQAGPRRGLRDAGRPRPRPAAREGQDLTDVPADLNQTFSGVREALAAAGPEHGAGRPTPRLRRPRRPSRPSTSSSAATRRGTSTASWSGSCRRRPPSGRPRPSSSRPGATSPRRS